jgi:hypothetical protein
LDEKAARIDAALPIPRPKHEDAAVGCDVLVQFAAGLGVDQHRLRAKVASREVVKLG